MNDPLMQNPEVRKAIYHAINKKEAVGQDLDYEVTHAILPFSLLGSKYSMQTDPYAPEVARQALKQLQIEKRKKCASATLACLCFRLPNPPALSNFQ